MTIDFLIRLRHVLFKSLLFREDKTTSSFLLTNQQTQTFVFSLLVIGQKSFRMHYRGETLNVVILIWLDSYTCTIVKEHSLVLFRYVPIIIHCESYGRTAIDGNSTTSRWVPKDRASFLDFSAKN